MENMNNNPIEEETVFEAPVYEAPVVEEPVEETIVETPVVEEPVQAVVEAPAYEAPEEVQALGSVADGVIGATTAAKAISEQQHQKRLLRNSVSNSWRY